MKSLSIYLSKKWTVRNAYIVSWTDDILNVVASRWIEQKVFVYVKQKCLQDDDFDEVIFTLFYFR